MALLSLPSLITVCHTIGTLIWVSPHKSSGTAFTHLFYWIFVIFQIHKWKGGTVNQFWLFEKFSQTVLIVQAWSHCSLRGQRSHQHTLAATTPFSVCGVDAWWSLSLLDARKVKKHKPVSTQVKKLALEMSFNWLGSSSTPKHSTQVHSLICNTCSSDSFKTHVMSIQLFYCSSASTTSRLGSDQKPCSSKTIQWEVPMTARKRNQKWADEVKAWAETELMFIWDVVSVTSVNQLKSSGGLSISA